ncbi:PAS domain S-box protein, partial [bacterium]|nr:PAS domain S-box protein [bacterium]
MTVKNLLRREYEVIAPDVAVASIEDRLVRDSFLAVMDEGKFIGLLTPSDIIQHPHKLVIDCLTDKPCVDCESKIEFVLELMQNSHNLALPVCKKNKFIGIIVHEDISDNFSEYRKELEEKVAERTAELTKTIEHLKRVTEDLRETHDYLENLINYANAPIIVWNPDFRIKRFNHAFEHLTGYKSDDVVGKALSILFPDAGRKVSLDKIKATSNGEYWESVEISILCKDGDIRLALWNSANIYAEDGKTLVSTIAQGTDITELRQKEKQINKTKRELENILNTVPIHIASIDINGEYKSWNRASENMFGFTAEEVIGKLTPRRFHRNDEEAKAVIDAADRKGKFDDEVILCRKDGSEFPAHLLVTKTVDSKGNQIGYTGVAVDITERVSADQAEKRANKEIETLYAESQEARKSLLSILADVTEKEQSLRESEEKYRAIFDNISEGIYRTTPDGKILLANPALFKMLGYDSAEELLKVNVRDGYKSPGDSQKFVELINKNGQVYGFESIWKKKDGTTLFIRENASIVRDENGEILYYDGTVEDITDRVRREEEHKRLEKQLHQSQKMESVGQLAGGIAHDFNNILTIISGYSQLLLERLDQNTPLRKNVEKIMKAGEQAASLTRQLLAFSRKQALAPKVLDLNATLADVKKMLGRFIGEDIKMDTVLEPDLMHVKVDPGQIEQVIMNLVVNARDAMPDGGKITVRTENVDIDKELSKVIPEALPGRFVRFSVEDAGVGIDKAILDQIFEPFFTTKDVGVGTGLGLSVVYGIIKQHDGWINVYSEPGQGTIFKVYL